MEEDLLRSKPPMNTTEGRTLPVLANAIAAFRHAPEWGGVLAFNEFGFGPVVLKPAPWGVVPKGEWTDHEDRLAAEWLQRQGVLVSVDVAGQAVQTVARDHPFHPVKAYLRGLEWYGVERLDRWLATYLGADDTDYTRAVGSRWLISAGRTGLRTWGESRLLPDSRRSTGHPKIDGTADHRRRVLHRRTGGLGQ